MYTPQTDPLPALPPSEGILDRAFLGVARHLVPAYARATRFKEPVMLHPERMIDAYRRFFGKEIRLIIGFRHAYGDDPQLMVYTLHHALPKAARKSGTRLRGVTHAHFIYGAEVPLWSGAFIRWLLPKVGAIPIDHIHPDAKGLTRIRKLIADGPYPLALAPEGHVTYGSERVGDLEQGTARFALWAAEDLSRADRAERVFFLPVSTHYRYGKGIDRKLSRFLARLEASVGIAPAPRESRAATGTIPERLRAIGRAELKHLARFYFGDAQGSRERTQAEILEAALGAAERICGIDTVAGDRPMARLYRIRTACWSKLFRDDIDGMTPLARDLAGRESGEAWYAMRHMETVELLVYVDLESVADGEPIERYVETANNYRDLLERLRGGTLRNRANEFDKYAIIVPGEPIDMGQYAALYKTDKKAALTAATESMRAAYEACVREYRDAYR